MTAAEAQLRVARATFDRQNHLIASGFTTRVAFDQAQEGLRTAEGSLEAANAQLGTAKDALGYTELRADASGVITARSLEVGQVVQAGQPVFSLAQDGERDAVFEIYEAIFFGDFDGGPSIADARFGSQCRKRPDASGKFLLPSIQRARPSASR